MSTHERSNEQKDPCTGCDHVATACSVLLIEDDHAYAGWIERSLRAAFATLEMRCVHTIADAFAALAGPSPRLAIIDLHLPDGSGTEAVAAIARRHPDTAILVITSVEDGAEAMAAIRAGAQGYIVKSRSDWDLAETVREVLAGGSPITPTIARRVLQALAASGTPPVPPQPPRETAGAEQLTPREAEIFRMAARGYRNKEIAARLDLSVNTVATHVKSVYRKLSVSSRTRLRDLMSDDG